MLTARLLSDIEGYPIFVPARSTNQSEYCEILELLSASWARARETTGISAPSYKETESNIAARGDLAILHHIVDYFSEAHNARLNEAAAKAEEEALDIAKAVADRKGPAARSLFDKKLLEEARLREAALATDAKQISNGDIPNQPYTTARSEVALAWLQIAILPLLEAEEVENRKLVLQNENEMRPSAGPSSSVSDAFPELIRPESSASTATLPGTASSRAASPSSAPSAASSKGKGKGRATDEGSLFMNTNGSGKSRDHKGKGREL